MPTEKEIRDKLRRFREQNPGLATRPQQEAALEAERRAARLEQLRREQAEGGSIRQDLPAGARSAERNFPVGATATALGGLALGVTNPLALAGLAVAGEAGQQGFELATGSQGAPLTAQESANRLLAEGIFSAIGGGTGRIAKRAVFGKEVPAELRVLPETQRALDFFRAHRGAFPADPSLLLPPKPVDLLPGQILENSVVDTLSAVADGAAMSKQMFANFTRRKNDLFRGYADLWMAQYGPRITPAEAGAAFELAVTENLRTAKVPGQALLNEVQRRTGPTLKGVTVLKPTTRRGAQFGDAIEPSGEVVKHFPYTTPTRGVKGVIQPVIEFLQRTRGVGKKTVGVSGDLQERIAAFPDRLPISDMIALRTEMRILREGAEQGTVKRQIAKVEVSMDKAIQQGLREAGPEGRQLLELWREGNRIIREGERTYNNRLIELTMNKVMEDAGANPEAATKIVLGGQSVKRIAKIRRAVGEETWQKFQRVTAEDLINRSIDGGVLRGKALERQIRGSSGFKRDALNEIFGKEQIDVLEDFSNAVQVFQRKQPGAGGTAIVLSQGGLLVALGTGSALTDADFSTEAGFVLLGPPVLARILMSPRAGRMLVNLLRTPKTGRALADALGRVMTAVTVPPETKAELMQRAESSIRREQGPSTDVSPLTQPLGTRAFPNVP